MILPFLGLCSLYTFQVYMPMEKLLKVSHTNIALYLIYPLHYTLMIKKGLKTNWITVNELSNKLISLINIKLHALFRENFIFHSLSGSTIINQIYQIHLRKHPYDMLKVLISLFSTCCTL